MNEIGDKNPVYWQTNPTEPYSAAAMKYYTDTYTKGGDVNPGGKAEFIGRGPVQVTHRGEYVEAIAMLEKAAEQYKKESKSSGDQADVFAGKAQAAATAIKKDPRQAANPEYAFLLSAAFLKGKGADVIESSRQPGKAWSGRDSVGGGDFEKDSPQAKALITKAAAYDHAYCVLMREAALAGVKEAEAKLKKGCGATVSQPQQDSPPPFLGCMGSIEL